MATQEAATHTELQQHGHRGVNNTGTLSFVWQENESKDEGAMAPILRPCILHRISHNYPLCKPVFCALVDEVNCCNIPLVRQLLAEFVNTGMSE